MSLVMLKVNHSSHTFHTFPQIFIFCFFVSDNILKGKYTLFHTLSLYFTHYSILFFLNPSSFLCVIIFCFIHNFTQLNATQTIKILFFQRFVEFTSTIHILRFVHWRSNTMRNQNFCNTISYCLHNH